MRPDPSRAATQRTTLGLVIGTNVQAYDAVLDDLAALTEVAGADQLIVSTGVGAYAHEAASTLPATIGGVIQDLDTLGAAASDGQFIVATGAGAFAYESTTTARTSLGVGTGDSPQFTGIELGHADDTTLARSAAGVLSVEGKDVGFSDRIRGINEQADSYTLVIGDAGKLIDMNNAAAKNMTVPPNASVAFVTGTKLLVRQKGAGAITIVAGDGVTINSNNGLILSAQYAVAGLVKLAENVWSAFGDLKSA